MWFKNSIKYYIKMNKYGSNVCQTMRRNKNEENNLNVHSTMFTGQFKLVPVSHCKEPIFVER
jgi:hypothetical protein